MNDRAAGTADGPVGSSEREDDETTAFERRH